MPGEAAAQRPRLVAGLRLERLVGSGGEGEVWQARDQRGRPRALKLVRPAALARPEAVLQRAAYLERIDHPALVRVHRSGLVDEGPLAGWGFLEMDLVHGRSLARAPGDWALLDELVPLAEALDLLHEGSWSDGVPLVHRDVKPANLIATPDGRVVLVDPSTLRGVDATSLTRIGTPVFAAPEVVTGRVGPPADVYSLAVTAIALVTGARGEALADLVLRAGELDLPAGVVAGVADDPADRPVSCVELLTEPEPQLARDVWAPAWEDAREEAVTGPRRVWPWVVLLIAVVVGPTTAWASGAVAGVALTATAVGAGVVHLAAHVLDGRSVLLAVVAPPIAWAFLLGDRLAAGRRRAWAHALQCGALLAAMGPVAAGVSGVAPAEPAVAAALTGAGLLVVVLAVAAVGARGGGGLALRAALLPVWAVGAVTLLAAGALALPFGLLAGRARPAARLILGTLAGLAEALRAPR